MRARWILTAVVIVLLPALLLLWSCEGGDKIPPKGSTITLAATPTTIPLRDDPNCLSLLGVTSCGASVLVATVYSESGAPLPDQDVRFSSTAGVLFSGPLSSPTLYDFGPIATDDFGNARLNIATAATSTVTARSGTATGTLTLNTVQGNLSQITVNPCAGDTTDITSCTQDVCLEVQALDNANPPVGIAGVVIQFRLQNNETGGTFSATFSPPQVTTDATGLAQTTMTPDSTCVAQCGGNKCSTAEVVAFTQGGFESAPLQLTINIP